MDKDKTDLEKAFEDGVRFRQLKLVYKIEFDCRGSCLPKDIYDLDKEVCAQFIRAFFDDEGHVYDSHIDVYSTNKELLLGLMKLFRLKFPEIKISELKINKRINKHHYDKYYFYVLAESREKYLELIGFDHKEKLNDLIFNFKRVKNRKYVKNAKDIILNHLKDKNLSAKQISRKLIICHGTALSHLNKLKQEDKVKIVDKGHFNENIWSLNF